MAADASNGYVVNFSVYLKSERKNRRIHGLGYDVVMKMARPFLNGNHHLFFDNYFSSPSLLDHFTRSTNIICLLFDCAAHTQRPAAVH